MNKFVSTENDSTLIHHKLFLLLFIPILVSSSNIGSSTTTIVTAPTKPPRLVMKLIRRDSVFSSYYNPDATISERVKSDQKSSIPHFSYLKAETNTYAAANDVRGDVIPDYYSSSFLVNLSIGQPPVPQLVQMDTGSSLLWVQCAPCIKCLKQFNPIFDPSKSSTYHNLTCNSQYCVFGCDSEFFCPYSRQYVGNTTTSGTLAMEDVMFLTSDEGITTIPYMVFGCGHENFGLKGQESGILGLSAHELSLASQLGYKFSYCIGNLHDPYYEYNQLIIGDGAKLEGYSTPIEVFNYKYYLTLEGISVGEKRLDIYQETFRRAPSGDGGVIIDSGTTFIYLDRGGFGPLREEVESVIGGQLRKVTYLNQPDWLCYKGMLSQDLKGFPVVTFHFAGGADLVLEVDAMFYPRERSVFCMAVWPANYQRRSIIGIMAQQYYNVAYDIEAMKLYFQRIDCELLED